MSHILYNEPFDTSYLFGLFEDVDASDIDIFESSHIEISLPHGYRLFLEGMGFGRTSGESVYNGTIQTVIVRTPSPWTDIVAIQKPLSLATFVSILDGGDEQAMFDFLLSDEGRAKLTLPEIIETFGSHPDNEIIGSNGDNAFSGTGGRDLIRGGGSDDELWGDDGNDTLFGGDGNDILRAGFGTDILNGGIGDDEIYGSADGDVAQFSRSLSDYSIIKRFDGGVYYLSIHGPDGFDYVAYVDWVDFGGSLRHVSTLPTHLKEQTLTEGVPWSYTLPQESFSHGIVTWSLADIGSLPSWLTYDSSARTVSGVPPRDGAGSFAISVQSSDPGRGEIQTKMEVIVTNVEDAPVITSFTRGAVSENAAKGIVVGVLSAYDPDVGDQLSFRLLDDAAGRFTLNGNAVQVADGVRLDYEQTHFHTIMVQVTDRSGASDIETFAIAVADVVQENAMGGSGNDVIKGGAAADKLSGGLGKDMLTGGKGKDAFVFDTKPNLKTNVDRITDFNVKDDAIHLDNKVFTKLGKKGTESKPAKIDKDFFTKGSKPKDKNDYMVYDNKKGVLYYDADGSGKGKAVEIVTLSKNLNMAAADFFVV